MTLQADGFLTLDGEPDLGRPPPRVIVHNGVQLTQDQFAFLRGAYREFTRRQRASVMFYAVHRQTLPDGTTVRIERNGRAGDRVFVQPPDPGASPIAIEGYLILPADKANPTGWNLGAIADSARALVKAPAVTTFPPEIDLHVKLQAGPVDWRSSQGVTITYDHGGNNRYATDMWSTVFYGTNADSAQAGVYYKGTTISTPAGVSAAGIYSGFLVIICGGVVYSTPSPIPTIDNELAQGRFLSVISPTWSGVTITGTVPTGRRASAWHFKPDGSIAAAAYVDASFGVGTWTLDRARTEAVTMMKRYLTFAIVSGAVQATVSDTAFTCEPIAVYVNGSSTPQNNAPDTSTTGGSGPLLFSGKRLWGVDWASDGTEIEVVFQRAGTGNLPHSVAGTTTLQWTQHWGVYANGTEIFKVEQYLPEITYVYSTVSGSPHLDSLTQTGTGTLKCEYAAVHAIDARYTAAVVERFTLQLPSAYDGTNAPVTKAAQLEVIFEASVVATHAVTVSAAFDTTVFPSLDFDPRFGVKFHSKNATVPWEITGNNRWLAWPQIGDWYTENYLEQLFHDGTASNRPTHNLFKCYPNQVSDLLQKTFWNYTPDGTGSIWRPFLQRAATSVSDPYFGTWAGTMSDTYLQDTYWIPLGQYDKLEHALAVRGPSALHFLAAGRDTFANQFYDSLQRLREENLGSTIVGIDAQNFASLFIRPTTGSSFTDNDLTAAVVSKVTADGNSPDSFTTRVDPVRVV